MKIIIIFSHSLTIRQKEEIALLDAEKILLSPELQKLWSQVPTVANTPKLNEYITPLLVFLKESSSIGDTIFVQGEFGMTNLVVQWCFANGRVPIYATTERKAVEVHNEDGSVELKHKFVHAGFREYEKLNLLEENI